MTANETVERLRTALVLLLDVPNVDVAETHEAALNALPDLDDLAAALEQAERELAEAREALREQIAWFQAHPDHACGAVAAIARRALAVPARAAENTE